MADFNKDGSKIFVKYTGHEQETARLLGSKGVLNESDVNICYNLYGGIYVHEVAGRNKKKCEKTISKQKKNRSTSNEFDVNSAYFFIWFVIFAGAFVGLYFLIRAGVLQSAINWLFDPQNKIQVYTDMRTTFLLGIIETILKMIWALITGILWLISWALLGSLGGILYGLPGILCVFAIIMFWTFAAKSHKKTLHVIISIFLTLLFIGTTVFSYIVLFSNKGAQSISANSVKEEFVYKNQTYKCQVYERHSYCLIADGLQWDQAKIVSQELGGHLVTITSADENAVVKQLVIDSGLSAIWLGATDKEIEGEWKWVTGESFNFTSWGKIVGGLMEPNGGAEANYLAFYNGHYENGDCMWDDTSNDAPLVKGFVVEFE